MSISHSLRKKVIKGLTGINPNRESTKHLFEDAKTIQNMLPSNEFIHKAWNRKVQAALNFDRGGITLAEAIEEGQI